MTTRLLARSRPPGLGVVACSLLAVLGCGVVNPDLVGTVGGNPATATTPVDANIVILVMNLTPVTAQASVRVTKRNQGVVELNIPVSSLDHAAVVQNCEVTSVEFVEASFAGPGGAVVVPASVSPLVVGQNLNCGGVVAITITGTPPGVFVTVQGF
jgi:hypothetical protein